MQKETLLKLLSSRPALWFLFLFNLTIAMVVGIGGHRLHIHGHTLHTSQQVMTSIGMAVVALGAGAGLLRGRRAGPNARPGPRQPGRRELPYR